MQTSTMSLGEYLRQRRIELGLEQRELAQRIQRDPAQLTRWERPSPPGWTPPYDILLALAHELRTPLEELVALAFPDMRGTRAVHSGVMFYAQLEAWFRHADISPEAKDVLSVAIRMAEGIDEASASIASEWKRLEDERRHIAHELAACRADNERLRDEVESLRNQW